MMRFSPRANCSQLINWHEWGEEAFAKARRQDKPVMLFLGAFWCGFCQRMDEDAFSAKDNLALLNAYFIAVRVENAERPDVDIRYNQNGWPTIAFMTAEGMLLATTNYLASEPFSDLLVRVYSAYQQKKEELRSLSREAAVEQTRRTAADAISFSALEEITQKIMELADPIYGGYGSGQKFIYSDANDFLLSRFERTQEYRYLNHVCLTLDRMRESPIHDHEADGYFRTSSGADWSDPHREKLLSEQAGLLTNCLRLYEITHKPVYAEMTEGIIGYLESRLCDARSGAFYGCEDFLRENTGSAGEKEFFSVVDHHIYTDANAQLIIGYLEAAVLLEKPQLRDRALQALDFLWHHCRQPEQGMFHYFDDAAQVPGLLTDQTHAGAALLLAWNETGDKTYLKRAVELGEFIRANLYNPTGGYWDLCVRGPALLRYPVTLLDQNGATASFFLSLGVATNDDRYRDAALWALRAYRGDFSDYGISIAAFGRALNEFLHQR